MTSLLVSWSVHVCPGVSAAHVAVAAVVELRRPEDSVCLSGPGLSVGDDGGVVALLHEAAQQRPGDHVEAVLLRGGFAQHTVEEEPLRVGHVALGQLHHVAGHRRVLVERHLRVHHCVRQDERAGVARSHAPSEAAAAARSATATATASGCLARQPKRRWTADVGRDRGRRRCRC